MGLLSGLLRGILGVKTMVHIDDIRIMQVLRDHIAPIMENRVEKIHMRGVSQNGGGEPAIDP